jgi:hypothetical protein
MLASGEAPVAKRQDWAFENAMPFMASCMQLILWVTAIKNSHPYVRTVGYAASREGTIKGIIMLQAAATKCHWTRNSPIQERFDSSVDQCERAVLTSSIKVVLPWTFLYAPAPVGMLKNGPTRMGMQLNFVPLVMNTAYNWPHRISLKVLAVQRLDEKCSGYAIFFELI